MATTKFDRPLAVEEITRLLLSYPEAVDRGDFAGVGRVFDGVRLGDDEPRTAKEFEDLWRKTVLTYDDGLPFTKHVVTNIDIQFAQDASTARTRSYYTVLQARPEFTSKIQVIIAGTYHDTFENDGTHWRWTERREKADLLGDLRFHVSAETLELLTAGHP
jgi:SnoaL-like domain